MAVSRRMWENQQRRKRLERKKRARRRRNCLLFVMLSVVIIVSVILLRSNSDNQTGEYVAQEEQTTQMPEGTEIVTEPRLPVVEDIPVEEKDFFENAVFLGNAFIEGIDVYGMLDAADFYSGIMISLENVYTTSSNNATTAIVDQLKSKKFSKVFLGFGEQELSWENSARFSKLYGELIEKVREYQPSANIFVFAIPPATEHVYNTDTYGVNLQNIRAYNRALKKLAMNEKLYYIDSFKALAGSGKYLDEGISADGINLDKNSYAKILNYASDKAYTPNATDIANDEGEDDSEDIDVSEKAEEDDDEADERLSKTPTELAIEREESSKKASSSKASPEPTVNVLKDSVKE